MEFSLKSKPSKTELRKIFKTCSRLKLLVGGPEAAGHVLDKRNDPQGGSLLWPTQDLWHSQPGPLTFFLGSFHVPYGKINFAKLCFLDG